MFTTDLTGFTQILMNLAIAVNAAAFKPRMLYMAQQALIFLSPIRQFVAAPRIVSAWMHCHHAAQTSYRILARMGLNKRVPQPDSLAKYAVAFFNISRSSDTRFSSAFNRRFSV